MEKKMSETNKIKVFNLAMVIKKEWRRNVKKENGKLQHLEMHYLNKKWNC